ncbi:MAG: hypothetical protein UY98_C0004G0011, partial [Candidatus Kaiserbacteria bacterium GW2011_GWA2_58_9]
AVINAKCMKYFFIGIGALVALALGATLFTSPSDQSGPSDPNILAVGGMHWHPSIRIFVKGEEVEIPQNVGIGAVHQPMHTHDDLPIIHLEFPAIVRKDDIRLGRFFEIWGRNMRSFGEDMLPSDERGSTEASGLNVRMTVNGKENIEHENYVMRDKDVIELHYDY